MSFAQVNNQNLFYEDSGGEGPPLLFLHGFLFDQTMFDAQVSALTPGYRCIRVDTRGFGQTQWDGQAFDLYNVVSDCIGLLDHLGIEKATFIGMSQGGYASIRLAIKHPERVKALVLMSTRKDIESKEFNRNYKSLRDGWVKDGATELYLDSLMTLLIGDKKTFFDYWDLWRAKWKGFSGNQMYHTINALLARIPVTEAQISQIQSPVLSIHGVEDYGTPLILADQLYDLFPNGKGKVRVKGAAHAVNMTHTQEVNPPLRAFLDEYVKGG
jgi:pimeloyl-ACP methyl ester carboxylesterase